MARFVRGKKFETTVRFPIVPKQKNVGTYDKICDRKTV